MNQGQNEPRKHLRVQGAMHPGEKKKHSTLPQVERGPTWFVIWDKNPCILDQEEENQDMLI